MRGIGLKELGVMVLLGYNHSEPRMPRVVEELAGLRELRETRSKPPQNYDYLLVLIRSRVWQDGEEAPG